MSFSFVCHVVVYKTNCMFILDWVEKNIGKYITSPVVTSKKSIMCVNLQWRTHTVYIIWFMHARMYKSRHTHELLFTYCCYNDTWCVPWLTERVNITIGQLKKYHSPIFLAKICPTNNIYTVNKIYSKLSILVLILLDLNNFTVWNNFINKTFFIRLI